MNLISELHRVDKLYGVPDFVKSAEFEDEDQLSLLPVSAFADHTDRRYPIHTKAACFLSNARFWSDAIAGNVVDGHVGERLLEWADKWGIQSSVAQMTKQASASLDGGALTSADYALTVEGVPTYPIDTATNLLASAENFYNQRHFYPYAMRKEASQRLLDRSSELGMPLDRAPYFRRATGDVVGMEKESVAVHVMNRAGRLRNTEHDTFVGGLARGAKQILDRGLSKEAFITAVETLDRVDRRSGLYRHYERDLPLPEEVDLDGYEKMAGEAQVAADRITLTTGRTVNRDELEKAGAEAFRAMPEYFDAVKTRGQFDLTKAAEVLPTMPLPDARLFQQSLDAVLRVKR